MAKRTDTPAQELNSAPFDYKKWSASGKPSRAPAGFGKNGFATKQLEVTKPAYLNTPAQYNIHHRGMVIENTGYLPTLADAKKFARARYGDKVTISCAYPASLCDGVQYAVA